MGFAAHDVITALYWIMMGIAGNMAHDTVKWWLRRNENKDTVKENE